MIDHPNGYASFYGHLIERPQLHPETRFAGDSRLPRRAIQI
jgi:hypothetical protein